MYAMMLYLQNFSSPSHKIAEIKIKKAIATSRDFTGADVLELAQSQELQNDFPKTASWPS